ncbi:MAG TPA: DUF1800 domain-containing protein [Planctomycetota bacterium]|nr:DUF1800 domain-containing protein [Planctomycetota bacterium]
MQTQSVTFTRHKPVGVVGNTLPQNDPSEDLSPWNPTATDPWDKKKVRHLARRAGFGLLPEEVETLERVGHRLSVDLYLLVPGQRMPERGSYLLKTGEIVNLQTYTHQVSAWLYLMANSPWQLQEKMALFWHDHFSTGTGAVPAIELISRSINLYRQKGMRSFRDLVVGVASDPAMLYFLDNRLSTVTRPNENFARELLELHMMGVGNGYTENDIKEAARCLTGWTCNLDYVNFNVGTHDFGVKNVLGRTIDNSALGRTTQAVIKDGVDVVDAALAQPATAKYIAKKLWEYFVYEAPSDTLVDDLAARFRAAQYDIRTLMETMFRSKAFFSARAMRANIKNPVEFVVWPMRTLDFASQIRFLRVTTRFAQMGLPLLNYAGPDGLPDGTAWINSQNIINRSNFAKELIENRARWQNSYLACGFDPEREIVRARLDTSTPVAIVDHFLDILVDGDVPPAVRQNLITYMTATNTGTRTWNYAGNKTRELNEKVAGLVHLILALPEAHIN